MSGIVANSLGEGADPAISWTLRLLLALVFARGLTGKLRAPQDFAHAIRGYALLPPGLVASAAGLLLTAELALVPALLLPATASAAALCAAALLSLYTCAIGINLARGRRHIDCGCSGPARRQSLHSMLVQRNLVYCGMALAAALPLGPRALSWLDGLTIATAVLTLGALVLAVDGLAALASTSRAGSQPRLGAHP